MAHDPTPSPLIARRVALGSASNFVGKAVGLGTWFLLTPFILDQLGPVAYGIWVLVGSLGAYGYLLDLGVAGAVIKFVSEHRARGEWDAAHDLVAAAVRVYLVLGAIVVLLGGIAAVLVPIVFTVPTEDRETAAWAIVLAGISIGISLAFMPATSILRGLQRYDLYNVVVTSGTLLSAAATVVVLLAGGGLVAMVAVNIPVTLLMQCVSVVLVRRIAPQLRFGWRGGGAAERGRITRFSGPVFAMNLSTNLQTRTDELVIAAFLPIAAVTPYALARRLSELSLVATDQFVKVLMPLASELEAVRDHARLQTVYVLSLRVTLAMLVPLTVFLAVFAESILVAWVGEAYAAGAPLVVVLAVAALFRGVSWPAATVLQGIARHRWIAVLSIISGLTNVGLSIALVGMIGVIGVALGTLIPATVEALLILPYGLSVMGIGLRDGVVRSVVPPLLPAAPMVLVLILIQEWARPAGVELILVGMLGMLVYGAGYLLLPSTRRERDMVRSMAHGAVRRASGSGVH